MTKMMLIIDYNGNNNDTDNYNNNDNYKSVIMNSMVMTVGTTMTKQHS